MLQECACHCYYRLRFFYSSRSLYGLAGLLIAASLSAHAADRSDNISRFAVATFENDLLVGGDSGYTNGIGVGWGYAGFHDFEGRLPRWLAYLSEDLYISTMPRKRRAITYGVGQQMFTPEDIEVRYPDPHDQPYAGLLLWRGALYAYDEKVSDRLALQLGFVGPASLAEQSQKLVHNILDSDKPKGWGEQIHNELVFRVEAQRNWRLLDGRAGALEFDMVGFGEAGVGTLRSDAGAGLSLRIGRGLVATLPTVVSAPAREANPLAGSKQSLWNVFFTVSGNYLFNDITLDGNTFRDSPSVDLKHEQVMVAVGLTLNIGDWGLLFALQRGSTDRFENQDYSTKFGSFSMTYRWPD